MTPETKKRIHMIYGIALSAVTIIAGICFIVACYNIYSTGVANALPQIYTRPIIAEAFQKIAVPVYLCLALVIGGFLLHIVLPPEKKKLVPEKNLPLILDRLRSKTDLTQCDEGLRRSILAQQQQRKCLSIISAVLLGVASVIFVAYAVTREWPDNSTPPMVASMYVMIACLAIPFGYTVFTAIFCKKSLAKEIELMKQASAQAPVQAVKVAPAPEKTQLMAGIKLAIIAVGIALVIMGVLNDGTKDILNKAIAICTECVGLG